MNNYYVSLSPEKEYTAYYKSIIDSEYFLNSMNFKPIPIQSCIENMENCLSDYLSDNAGIILIQYPRTESEGLSLSKFTDYMKTNYKNYRLVAVVHDLDSVRYGNFFETNDLIEVPGLNEFDYLITVNDAMTSLLKEQGVVSKMYSVTLFDYVLPNIKHHKINDNKNNMSIAYAGNLQYEKSPFIYDLDKVDFKNIKVNLYGPGLNNDKYNASENINYKGTFPPDDLPNQIKDGFGLCWDGSYIDQCGGKFCEYMRYGNPHKTSLYLAMGIPVIISKDIGASAFVEKEHVGITIETLYDIPKVLNNISDKEYKLLQKNARKISKKLRNGCFIKHVINDIEENIQSKL